MAITGNLYTVSSGTAVGIVAPSVDAQTVVIKNDMPDGDLNQHVRDGYAFAVHTDITLANGGSQSFSFTTGDFGAQILGYKIASTVENVEANLIEGATITTNGTAVPAYNLNRTSSITYDASLVGVTSISGGTVVSSESIFASNQASGGMDSSKVITLAPNTQYAFKFNNIGSQSTYIHFEMIWTERYNGYTTVWLNGAEGVGYPLHGGESVAIDLIRGQAIDAISGGADCQIAVMRQD